MNPLQGRKGGLILSTPYTGEMLDADIVKTQADFFSVFEILLQRVLWPLGYQSYISSVGPGVWTHDLPCRRCSTKHWQYHQALQKLFYVLDLVQTYSHQGCTVRPEISAGQNSSAFVFSASQESPASELWPSFSFKFCVKQRIHGLLVAQVMWHFYCGNK
jgi:hypothetical protein